MRHFNLDEENSHWHLNTLMELMTESFQEVLQVLGPGLECKIYKNALKIELKNKGAHIREDVLVLINYKGIQVGNIRVDFILQESDHNIAVNLIDVGELDERYHIEMRAILRFSELEAGVIINIGKTKPDIELIVI